MREQEINLTIIVSGLDKEEVLHLTGNNFIFGRNSTSHVWLNDPAFSRSHFKISILNNLTWITDLKSSNGTKLNQQMLDPEKATPIAVGDEVTVKNAALKIYIKALTPTLNSNLNQESDHNLDLDVLSAEIVNIANANVEKIISEAHKKAEEIVLESKTKCDLEIVEKLKQNELEIAEKIKKNELQLSLVQQNIRAEIDKYEKDNKDRITKELESYKTEHLLEINMSTEKERIKLQHEIDKTFEYFKEQQSRKKEILNSEIDEINQKISFKKNELVEIEHSFKKTSEQLNKEIDAKTSLKRIELQNLEQEIETQREIQVKKLQDELSTKILENEQLFHTYKEKTENAQIEFEENAKLYELKRNDFNLELDQLTLTTGNTKNQLNKLELELKSTFDKNELLQNEYTQLIQKHEKLYTDTLLKESEYNEIVSKNESFSRLIENEQLAIFKLEENKSILEKEISNNKNEIQVLLQEKTNINNEIIECKNKASQSRQDAILAQNDSLKNIEIANNQFLQEKSKLSEEMRKLKDAEEKRLQEITRQELNQINKIKEDSLRLILDLEDSITKELTMSTSKVFATTIGMEKFREISTEFEKSVRTSLQNGVLKLLKNELTPIDANKGKKLSTNKTILPFVYGVILSAVFFIGGPLLYKYIQNQNDPIKNQLELQAKAEVAPVKKFIPLKTSKLGDTIVDCVIYTENYVENVSKEQFRSELMKQGSVYLFKQWQIEEEKSIQAFSMIFSLIDTLKNRTEKIDPDFEKRDIDKMVLLEKETLKKLETILGNEVRLEAAIKFYNRFYQDFSTKP